MSDEWIKVIGIVAGVFTALSLLPQLVKLVKTKKAEDISLLYLITLFCGISLWIWYGILFFFFFFFFFSKRFTRYAHQHRLIRSQRCHINSWPSVQKINS